MKKENHFHDKTQENKSKTKCQTGENIVIYSTAEGLVTVIYEKLWMSS